MSSLVVHKKASLLRDVVFAANDGIITTFAVVAGSFGASFSFSTVLTLGFANLFADGFAMASGNYMGVKSEEEYESIHGGRSNFEGNPLVHGFYTFISFNLSGFLPLIPYVFRLVNGFYVSLFVVAVSLFIVGAARSIMTQKSWYRSGLEMLAVGGSAAFVAYITGHFLKSLNI